MSSCIIIYAFFNFFLPGGGSVYMIMRIRIHGRLELFIGGKKLSKEINQKIYYKCFGKSRKIEKWNDY